MVKNTYQTSPPPKEQHFRTTLFKKHYLAKHLKNTEQWKKEDNARMVYEKILGLYRQEKGNLGLYKERELEEKFVEKVLTEFGFILSPHPTLKEWETSKEPDYALFLSKKEHDDAIKFKDSNQSVFYNRVTALCEAKSWDIDLDKDVGSGKDRKNPCLQICKYLLHSGVGWGILTNGKIWRLFCGERKHLALDKFFEINLEKILEQEDFQSFKYFYCFFSKEGFTPKDKPFVKAILDESILSAKQVGDEVKENVYKALVELANGFFSSNEKELDKYDVNARKEVYNQCLNYLYRMLFILYAEAQELLPVDNQYYKSCSLNKIKKEVHDKTNKATGDIEMGPIELSWWHKLADLFRIIDKGHKIRVNGEEKVIITSYNGSLFKANKFFENNKVYDVYLGKVINLLARAEDKKLKEKVFVDYYDFGVRHLGSIYEGLLEYKLEVAKEPMVAVKKDKKEEWIPESKFKGKKYIERVDANKIYPTNDKCERRATGSYYTPEYIVEYIVENTLTPIVKEKIDNAIKKGEKCSDAILSIKVLDPAMGSGHFLVEAVEFLGKKYVDAVIDDKMLPVTFHEAKRKILAHCIYGVDRNPLAVELAKLSLWLTTISKDKPLSFLDHRLKCGDSLIGAQLADVHFYPEIRGKAKKAQEDKAQRRLIPSQFIEKLLDGIRQIDATSDDTLEAIKTKEELFEKWKQTEAYRRIKALADIRTAVYFGCKPQGKDPVKQFGALTWAIVKEDSKQWEEEIRYGWKKEGLQLAEQKRFFHWELEFPEVFYEVGKEKENPGFDAVVGNPPYLRIQELQKGDPTQVSFFNTTFVSATTSYDIYVLFNEFGLHCLKRNGRLGMIQPSKFIQADFGKGVRKILPKYLDKIIDFRENQIFDVSTYTCLLFLSKIDKQEWSYFATPALKNVDTEMPILLDQKLEFSILSKDLTEAPWILSKQDNLKILKKLNLFSEQLKDVVTNIFQGIATSADHIYFLEKIEKVGADKIKLYSHSTNSEWILETTYLKPLLKGEDVHRYESLEPNIWTIFPYDLSNQNHRLISGDEIKNNSPKLWEYLKLNEVELRNREHGRFNNDEWWQFSRPQNLALYGKKKIMTPDICNKGEISYDNAGYCHTTTVYSFVFKEECQENILFWNSILNSSLVWYFISNTGSILRGGFFRFKTNYLKPIPIRRISFTTPAEERTRLVEEAKKLYAAPDFAALFKLIDECLPKDASGNFVTEKEKSDVVHDILAFLAEQMLEMNKEKNAEIKSFLAFLKCEIGASIEELSNKTAIRGYYKNEFQKLIDVLVKNKKKLRAGYDPKSPTSYKHLLEWYNASIDKLKPLMGRIEATDRIIDQIVYKLYGLTEEEIKIVEGSIGKK